MESCAARRRNAFRQPPITKLSEPHEPGPRLFLVLVPRRNQHQAGHSRGPQRLAGVEYPPRLVRRRTEFRFLSSEVNLDEQFGSRPASAAAASSLRSNSTESTEWMQ